MAKSTAKARAVGAVATAGGTGPQLDTEVASRLTDPFDRLYMGVLRSNDPLLMERGGLGSALWETYRDLKRDGKVFAALQKRRLAVVGRPWQVEPAVDSAKGKADAATVSDILRGFNFDALCSELMDALLVGWVPAEIVWTVRDGLVVPARVVKRAQRRFVYVQDDANAPPELRLLVEGDMQRGVPLQPRKFIVHRLNAEDDNPYGMGLGLQLYWPVFFKRKGVVAWNKLNDRFGAPTPWGKYPRGAERSEKLALLDGLKSMSNDGAIVTPEGSTVELLESKLTGSVSTQQGLCEYMDDWIAEVVLGQAPRGKGGGALAAAANEREDVRIELSQADSDLLSETLNRTLLAWLCEFNGFEPCQVVRIIKKEDDLKAMAEADAKVAGMGFKPSLEGVRARYGEYWNEAPAPAPSAPPLSDAAQPKAGAGETTDFAEAASAPDALDALVDAELDQWKPVVDPLVDPIRALLEKAAAEGLTAGQLLTRLPQLLGQLDADPLAQSLTRAGFTARLGALGGLSNA